jgi:hypothetical protein
MRRLAGHVLVLITGRIAFDGPLTCLEAEAERDVRRFLAAVAADDEKEGS